MALNFYHFTPSAEKYGAIEPEPAPVKPQQGIGGDMLDSATAGLYNATGGILDMVGAKGFAKNFYGWADENIQEMSDRGQQAMSKSIVQKDEQGDWELGEGATDFDTWLLGFANMAGQFAPTMIPGAGAASLATKAGMGALGVNAARIGGYAAAGGSAATGQAMEEARQEVSAMPDGVLMQSERFKRLIGELDKEQPGLDDDALWDAAKARLADQVATDVQTDPKVLIANYAASAIGDPIIGRALAGARIAKGALGSAAKGFAVEGTTEAAQAGVTKYGVNEALQPIDVRDAMQGVDVAAANEGIMGGLFGGVIGGTGGVWNRGASPEADQQMPADSGSVIAPSGQPVQPDPSMNLPPQVEQALAPEPSIQDIISQVKDPDAIQLESTNPALAEAMHNSAKSAAVRQLDLESIMSDLKETPVAKPAIPQNENFSSITAITADGPSQSQGVPADEGRIEPRLTGFDWPAPTASEPVQFVPENLAADNNASEPGNTLNQPEAAPAQPVQVKGNGIPWPTAADAVRSKTARVAKKAGQKVEAVQLAEGWGWRVTQPATTEVAQAPIDQQETTPAPVPMPVAQTPEPEADQVQQAVQPEVVAQPVIAPEPQMEVAPAALETPELAPTLRDRKEAARQSAKPKENKAVNRSVGIIGAKAGDTIRIDGSIGYAGDGEYFIEQINNEGTVFISDGQGTTNLTVSELVAAKQRGEVSFTKLDKKTDSQPEIDLANDLPAATDAGVVVESDANSVKVYGDPVAIRQQLRSKGVNFDGAEIDGGLSFGKKLEGRVRAALDSDITEQQEGDAAPSEPDMQDNNKLQYRRVNTVAEKPKRSTSAAKAQAEADRIVAKLSGASGIKVTVLDTQAELEQLSKQNLEGSMIRGAYASETKTAYVIAENITGLNVLRTVVAHEVLAHGGLDTVIGKDKYQEFISRLTQTRNNKLFKSQWDMIDQDYDGLSDADKAEELFAYYAERQPVSGPIKFWWNALKRWLHKTLVSVGLAKAGDPDLDLMDDMIESIRAGFMFKRNAAKAAPENTEPTELAFSKTSKAEAVTGAINDVIGRKRLDPNDPYAVENRRLREQDRTLWDKAKQVFMRNFAPGGMLPKSIFDAKITRDGELESGELAIKHLILALERAVQKDTGKDINSQSDEFVQMTADALTGKVDNKLGAETKAALVAMRQYIDALSGDYLSVIQAKIDELTNRIKQDDKYPDKVKALNEIDLYEKIKGNMGVYVNRSYRAFDDPKWFQKVPVETINRARDYLRNQYKSQGDDQAEASRKAEVTLNKILKTDTAYDSMASFIAESKLGAKDLSTLIARKDISPEIRELLGEYKDPRMNFAKTATKMARLVWNSRFLNKVKADGVGVFFFDEDSRPAEATVQIAGDQSKTYEPLNGYWTFPEVAEALQDSLGTEQMEAWYEAAVKLTSIVKYGKTVLSPTTAMRNWQSAMFFAVANGHFDFKHMKKSMAAFREQVTQNAKGDDLAYLKKLKKLGVVYDAPYAGEMMQLLADSKIDEWLEGRKGKVFGTARQVNNLAQGFYSFGDDFWKIIGFENEKANFIKAGLTESEAEKTAAERIRNTYPTYSMVGRAIKKLARFPLMGTFVSFPAEIIRTTANMLRYAAEDMKSNNPKIRAMARKRLTGMALVSGLFYALSAMTAAMLGVGDDEEEAIRDVGPSWQKNSTFLFYGRDDKGKLQYFDISFLDPYGYFKRPITALLRDQPWEDAAASGAADMLSPFFGADITAGTFFQVFANKKQSGGKVYNEYADGTDQLVDITEHIFTGLRPGFINNGMGIFNAAVGNRREGSGKEYDLGDEMLALLGWRASSLDAPTSIYYRSFEFGDQLSAANSTLNKVLRSDNDVDDEDIADAKEAAQRQYDEAFKQMQRIVESGRAAGMTKEQIYKTLKLSGISSKNISGLIYGKTPPMQAATLQTQVKAVAKAREIRGDEQASEVLRRFQLARQLQ